MGGMGGGTGSTWAAEAEFTMTIITKTARLRNPILFFISTPPTMSVRDGLDRAKLVNEGTALRPFSHAFINWTTAAGE
jgi:hypothetical protein